MARQKTYYINVYSDFTATTLIKTLPIGSFKIGNIKKQINVAPTFTFTLANKFDDFGEGYVIKMNNRIDLYVTNPDNEPEGTLYFSGYIYAYNPQIVKTKESVRVDCIGYLAKMAKSMGRIGSQVSSLLTNGTGIDTIGSAGVAVATPVESVFAAVITMYRNAYNTQFGKFPPINYLGTPGTAGSTIQATGMTMTYIFNERFFLEMLNDCLACCPAGWYFTVNANNIISLQVKPTAPVHTFSFIKDFTDVSALKTTDNSYNNVVFESSNAYINMLRRYEDTTSEALMDDRWIIKKDNNVVNTTTADAAGNQLLANAKGVKVKTQVLILDNNVNQTGVKSFDRTGYEIDKIKEGDTCQFANFADITSLTFDPNMLIASINWTPESAMLDLIEIPENTARDAVLAARSAQVAYGSSGLSTMNTANGSLSMVYVGTSGAPAFQNGWINYVGGTSFQGARFWKDAGGVVHLEGLISTGTIGATIFTLPNSYIPPVGVLFAVFTAAGTVGRITVLANGNVVADTGTNATWTSISGISFSVNV